MDDEDVNIVAELRAQAERTELMRLCAARIVDHHESGRRIADDQALQWARDFVRFNPPLSRPLGTGEAQQ